MYYYHSHKALPVSSHFCPEEILHFFARNHLTVRTVHLDEGIDCSLGKIVGDTKLGGVVYTPEICTDIQSDLDSLRVGQRET